MTKKQDTYTLSGGNPVSPSDKVHHDITETNPSDGFHIDHVEKVSVVTLLENNIVDAVQIEKLGNAIEAKLKGQNCPVIVVDLKNVNHLSSAALGMFLKLRTFATGRGGNMCLCGINDQLNQVFKVTRLDKMLKMYDSRAKAVQALKKSK